MQRTIRIKLDISKETANILTQTIEQYTWSFNATCQYGWDNNIKNGSELHKATYYEHRSITKLPAQLVCAARVKATEALKSAFAIKKKVECRRTEDSARRTLGEVVTCPESKRCSIRYDARSYSLWKESFELTLLTIKGRVKIKFSLPNTMNNIGDGIQRVQICSKTR